ncbi:von Willebrand factor D and EGF domain-containing protein-like [Dreissena polymorpha]|uniref:VWFD domain-containing protein n=1 Tax=Dreissena polymorpha TaxID=45954 RepID=A0A9D4HTT9_DREPO|nr:von Willebrand factor D and EGF domain-containing protein-like [Dreissena polymorpha]KAH3730675.1 hypothetical protein DPMN_056666 [Dreissena polymorpha]
MIIIYIAVLGGLLNTVAMNPCTDSSTQQLGSIRQRHVGYQLAKGEDAICDVYLKKGWYFTDKFILASTKERCGTVRNWYRKDKNSLPDKPNEPKDIVLCRNGRKSDCDKTVTVKGIKCADNNYVFQLIPASACIEAYCLEPLQDNGQGPDITNLKLSINVEVKRLGNGDNELQLYCDFKPSTNTNYYYTVAWAISQSSISTHELHRSQRVKYLNQNDFRSNTMMTENHLKTPRYFGLGVTIICSITASNLPASTESVPVISPEKFLGIRALNSQTHVHITNQIGADIFYELTIPFGCNEGFEEDNVCFLDATLFIPQTISSNCNKPDIIQSNSETNSCGLRFYRHDVGTPKKLHIQPKFPTTNVHLSQPMTLILTTTEIDAHPLFNNYAVDTIQVTVSTEQIVLNNKVCHAVCDPHMLTFDGLAYENQNFGTFDLYIHTDYNQKIQIETKSCSNNGNTPTCVCGVAVQAGGDVFVLNACDNGLLDVRFVQCGDRILQNKVNEISPNKYRVTLPSGTYVDIHIYGALMNVFVYPSVADFKKTSGLCGLFDGTTINDRLNRPGSNHPDPNKSWMVNAADNLFDEDVSLQPWADHYRFCTCDEQTPSPTNTVTCDAETKKTCNAIPIFTDRCVDMRRKRRDANGRYQPTDEGDFHKTVQLAFVSNFRNTFIERKKREIKVYTEETARRDCMQLLNTIAFQKCSNVSGLNFTATIKHCILDALITGTMDWTMLHLETIKSLCVQQVIIQKLPPKEDLFGITVIINGTSYTNISDEDIDLPFNVITEKTLEEIRRVACLNECSGFGKCFNGSCVCKKGRIGEDCSLDATRPPQMKGIPDGGVCDLQERACRKTSVFADNLIFDNLVKCRIEPQEINSINELLPKGNYQVAGVRQTYMEVSCPFAQSDERTVNDEADIDDIVARVYNISLSNDGVNFSEDDSLIVYDSACVICRRVEGFIECRKENGYCVTNGKCYALGDIFGSYVCGETGEGPAAWQPGFEDFTKSLVAKNFTQSPFA